MEITLYLVGEDADDACGNFPFGEFKDAEAYRDDEIPNGEIYSVTADIDFSTVELCE